MTPSAQCKAAGLKSLEEFSQLSGESVQTLNNWHKSPNPKYRRRFILLLKGILVERFIESLDMDGEA